MKTYEILSESLPFWSNITNEQQNYLCERASLQLYKKGSQLGGNLDCVGIMIIKSGQLRTYLLSEEGREITLFRLFKDDVCVLSASCILDAISFDVFLDAQEDTEVCVIPSDAIRPLMEQNVYVKCFAYEIAAERFSDVMWAMQQILFMGIDKRLAIFLLQEIKRQKTTHLSLTHEQTARYMATAREVVTRMLKYFQSEEIVKLSRGYIDIIDIKRLESMI